MKLIFLISFFYLMSLEMQAQYNYKYKTMSYYNCYVLPETRSVISCVDTVFIKNQSDLGPDSYAVITYKDGIKTDVTGYYENWNLYKKCKFNNSNLVGFEIEYYENGSLKSICYNNEYINTKECVKFFINGKIMEESAYLIGYSGYSSVEYYENGNKKTEQILLDTMGRMKYFEYYESGKLKLETRYNDGIAPVKVYYESGKIQIEGEIYQIPMDFGNWTEWYENGQKKCEYSYSKQTGLKDGIWRWWDENGNVIKEEVYKDDILIKKQ